MWSLIKNFSWSVSLRHMWVLHHDSHRFFMEVLGGTHARTMLFSRFTSFVQSLMRSQKPAVILLFLKVCQNVNSVTGKNIRYILNKTKNYDILKINAKRQKRELRYCSMKEEDEWKPVFIKELTDLKYSCRDIPGE